MIHNIFKHETYCTTGFKINVLLDLLSEQEVYICSLGETFHPVTVGSCMRVLSL